MARCQDRTGFLFAHDCDRQADDACAECERAVCSEHGHWIEEKTLCTPCAKRHDKRGPDRGHARGRKGRTGRRGREDEHDHDDPWYSSPYFYGYSHYYGFGSYRHGHWGSEYVHDPHDFTEADAGSLTGEEGAGFEHDVGGS